MEDIYKTYLFGGKMQQVGYKNFAILTIIFILFSSTIFATNKEFDTDINTKSTNSQLVLATATPPVIYDTFYVCPGDSIYDTLFYACRNVTSPDVFFGIIDGEGSFTTEIVPSADSIFGYFSYLPPTEGDYSVLYLLVNGLHDSLYYFHTYTVFHDNIPPVIADQYFSSVACDLTALRDLQILASDSTQTGLTYTLLSGQGSINTLSGVLSYQPDTSGIFEFTVMVENGCGADTALIIDSVHLNSPPQVFCYDSLVTICQVEEICFDVFGIDADSDPVQLFMLEGIGDFTLTSDSTGTVCFIPADVDSAVYRFIFRAIDSCTLYSPNFSLSGGECCSDTSLITVVINRPPVLTCPDPQTIFLCDSSEICIDLYASDYENSDLIFNLLSGNAVISDSSVCFTATTSGTYEFVVEAVDDCGFADTCTVTVTVEMNVAPVVNSADDFAITLCNPEEVCFSATADDLDFNITDISLNLGTYNQSLNQICFTPDTSGLYTIVMTATDSCGLVDSSVTNVTIHLNETPTFDLGLDYALEICAEQEICIEPIIVDDNFDRITTNFSFYNEQTGLICFVPDTSGSYQLIAEASDDCGVVVIDTINIDVTILEKATLDLGDSLSLPMCTSEEICVDVLTTGNLVDVIYNFGQLNETGQICFTPDTSGVYILEAELTDSCGFKITDTKIISIELTSAPIITNFNDTTIYLCQPVEICLPALISDADNDIVSITTSRGTYADGSICFVPYDSGSYEFILTATDSCGNVTIDTAHVLVKTDQAVSIVVPNDTTFFVCQLDTFCFPVSGIPVEATVSVTGINTWYDAENSQICYFAECSSNNKITLTVSTECNTFTEQFNVTVICNSNPLVILPQDTTIFLCAIEPINLPVGVTDADGNLVDVSAIGGTYDNILNLLSFTPDTSGTYYLSVSAIDSCEAVDSDEIAVTVVINEAPVCVVPENAIFNLCEPTQISLPIFTIDADSNNVVCEIVSGAGQIIDGNWVYNTVADDSLTVTIRCTDGCGAFCEETFTIIVHMNNAPQWQGDSVYSFEQCLPTEVFIPFEAFDIDGDALTFRLPFDIGPFNDSGWYYTPTGSETIEFTARVSDSCGAFADKLFTVTFDINEAPIVDAGDGFETFLCEPGEACFDVTITDDNRAYTSIPNGFFNWSTEQYCFNADTSGVYIIEVSATDSCDVRTVDTVVVTVTINEAPICALIEDFGYWPYCDSLSVSVPITATDIDSNLVNCQIIEGPGQIIDGNWVYTSFKTEDISITIQCVDECGAVCENSFNVTFIKNQLPEILDQNFAQNYCDPDIERTLEVIATDNDIDAGLQGPINYELISGVGVIDPITGVITYSPDTSGTYLFTVLVSDYCGADTALITDVIGINNPPIFNPFDTTVYLCNVEDICFDISATDADGDPIIFSLYDGIGKFTQLTDTTGQTCFTPEDVDSATYTFVYCVTDSCGDFPEAFVPVACEDTVRITVVINRAPQIVCPTDMKFFSCETDTFCFDIDANDPEFVDLNFNILSGNASITGKTVCVVSNQADSFDVVIEVVDDCGHADTCTVPVTIESNRSPYVNSADDFAVSLCEPEIICFAVTADDLDFNLSDIYVNFGVYDEVNDQVCFEVDSSGQYTIITTATDTCGAVGVDTTVVTVKLNEAPIVDAGEDFAVSLCEAGEVCIDVTIVDDNRAFTSIPNGFFNWTNELYCFNADTSGVYEIVVSATDSCGVLSADTVIVTVLINQGPSVDLGDDLDLFVCDLGEYCVDVSTINNFDSIVVNGDAVYDAQTSQLCFNFTEDGVYYASVQVFDTCGLSAFDEINLNIRSNNIPTMSQMPDTTVYICNPTAICLPLDIQDDNIASISVNRGTYENGEVCFVPYDSGTYEIIVTVLDSCGLTIADTAIVQVLTDQGIEITGQTDTTIFVCELDTLCFPVYGIPAGAVVTVSGLNTWFDAEKSEVCYLAECSSANKLKVTATTECGSFEYSFTVTVVCNTAPLVILPQDSTMTICGATQICLPIGITDVDNNLGDVIVTGGNYDPILSQLCFNADTAGTYIIGVTANDTCGASDYDEITVTVIFNSAPEIRTTVIDSTLLSCGGAEICIPLTISDRDNNLLTVVTSIGVYNVDNAQVCFVPDTSGLYCIEITATDACGLITIDTACVIVEVGGFVQFECPTNIVADSICGADTVCIPLVIDGEVLTVVSSVGNYANGQLCFFADTAGIYTVSVTATGDCNEISCEFTVEVFNKIDVVITCPENLDTLLCGIDTLYFDYTISSSVESIIVSSPAYIMNNQIILPIASAGNYNLELVASGECGIDTCSFNINARFNSAPAITSMDTTLTVCTIDTICLPFEVFDIDTNLVDVTTSVGEIKGNTVCVLPIAYGQTSMVLTATDSCGAVGTYVANINLIQGATAAIICPQDQFATLCGSDSICVLIPITPIDADITILDNGITANAAYDIQSGQLCLFVAEAGLHKITLIADAMCGADTCEFDITATLAQPPSVSSPANIDTLLCLADPETFCFDVQTSGTGLTVDVNPAGSFSAGVVCIPVDTAGIYEVEIIASNDCGTDTSYTIVTVTGNTKPILNVPPTQTFLWCPDDTNTICIDGIFAQDAVAITSFDLVCGVGVLNRIFSDTGVVCFIPDTAGTYTFCVEASDGCHIVTDTFYVDIVERDNCDVCVRLTIDGGDQVPVGVQHDVILNVETNDIIGGFDVLISFDASVMTFNTAVITGSEIEGWEYFTYRIGSDDCGVSCPSGLVRLVGLADLSNGPNHPPTESLQPNGTLVTMSFLVANDQNLGDLFLPIEFVWYDCGDNSFSNTLGSILYLETRIFNSENFIIWDESDDDFYPESSRPFGLGANDQCLVGASSAPIRCVEFVNGGIKVIHPDSIDARGDINLNNINYEIGDAVLFSNYFIFGLGVFTINVPGQIAASDVNADGLTLSVADLVLMIRIIVGDANPVPKLVPYSEELILVSEVKGSEISVSTNAVSDIGGMLLVYDLDESISINAVKPSADASEMQMGYAVVDNQLRILVYDIGRNFITSGKNNIVDILFEGDGEIALSKVEVVDYQGTPYNVLSKLSQIPDGYALNQNYPNPFNPSTIIELAIPVATDWTLTVYNVSGHLVRKFTGNDEAGLVTIEWDGNNQSGSQVASGIYLYRLEAGEFSATKKMILLK